MGNLKWSFKRGKYMINILIVEDNIIECKQIVNYISQNSRKIKLYSMVFNGKEAIEIIKNKNIDIILLDLKLPDITGVELIKKIEEISIKKYQQSIIIVSGEMKMMSKVIKSPLVYKSFNKPVNLKEVFLCINQLISEKELYNNKLIIKKKINHELEKLHFNFSYIGTKYLNECIYELYNSNNTDYENLSKNIYPIIGKRYNKSANTIYCDIKQSVKAMYYDCEEKTINEYFKYSYFMKPKLKEIIFTILKNIYN